MTTTFSPSLAARIAAGVYEIKKISISEAARRGISIGCEELFAIGDSSRLTAVSGELCFKQIAGFGYIAAGTGSRQGEVLIGTRGTDVDIQNDGLKGIADGLTDFNIGLQPGPSGRSYRTHPHFSHKACVRSDRIVEAEHSGILPANTAFPQLTMSIASPSIEGLEQINVRRQ